MQGIRCLGLKGVKMIFWGCGALDVQFSDVRSSDLLPALM